MSSSSLGVFERSRGPRESLTLDAAVRRSADRALSSVAEFGGSSARSLATSAPQTNATAIAHPKQRAEFWNKQTAIDPAAVKTRFIKVALVRQRFVGSQNR
jgi:hypothetical protein